MEAFEPLLHVVRGLIETCEEMHVGQDDVETSDFKLQTWAQIDYRLTTQHYDELDDFESIHPSPPPTAPVSVRLSWALQRAMILQKLCVLRNRRDSRDSCELTDRELRDQFHQLSRNGTREKNIVSWLDQTYTTHSRDEEYRRHTSELLRRANSVRVANRRGTLKRSGSLPHAPTALQHAASRLGSDRRSRSKLASPLSKESKLSKTSSSAIHTSTNLAMSTPNLRDLKRAMAMVDDASAEERSIMSSFDYVSGDGQGAPVDARFERSAVSPKPWDHNYDASDKEDAPPPEDKVEAARASLRRRSSRKPKGVRRESAISASTSHASIVVPRLSAVSDEGAKARHSLDSSSLPDADSSMEKPSRAHRLSFKKIMKSSSQPELDVYEPSDDCAEFVRAHLNEWDMDLFKLTTLSDNHPLAVVALEIFHRRGMIKSLRLDQATLLRFFTNIENFYGRYPEIPYHNNTHAADVMVSVHYMLSQAVGFTPHETFATLVAAAVHDVNHPGRTNNFLVKTGHHLAVLYNDRSVLENHHLATAFNVIYNTRGCNILANFTQKEQMHIRKLIVDMVMSTDMVKHTKFLGEFRALLERAREQTTMINEDEPPAHIMCTSDNIDDRALVLCNIVHTADLASPTKPWILCKEWTRRICNEFWLEGDEERELGLDLGALNDRHGVPVPKAQIGFINFIAKPLWRAWNDFVSPDADTIQLRHLQANLSIWEAKAEQLENASESEDDVSAAKAQDNPATQTQSLNVSETSVATTSVSTSQSPTPSNGTISSRTASLTDMTASLPLSRHKPQRFKSVPSKILMQRARSMDSPNNPPRISGPSSPGDANGASDPAGTKVETSSKGMEVTGTRAARQPRSSRARLESFV